MSNIETIVRQINKDFVPQFEEKLRAYLVEQDKEWLIEQIVRLTLDAQSLQEMDRKHTREQENLIRAERTERVKKLNLDQEKLNQFSASYKTTTREELIQKNFLKANTPAKGTELITAEFRSNEANDLLQLAKDMLFGLLFGEPNINVHFNRIHRELLTLTVPRMKSSVLNFMKATTELSAMGTWQDPSGAASDMRADNVVLEIEYGEIEGEQIGHGIVAALRLLNNLEINEEILYGRMENIEQSTLIA